MAQDRLGGGENPQLAVKSFKLEGSRASLERGRFIQVFEYNPPEGEKIPQNRGKLFAVVDLLVGPGVDAVLAGKLVWATLTGSFYDQSEEMPVRALEEAIYAARDRLRDFSDGGTLHLVAASVVENVAYLARVGEGVLYLRRGPEVRDPLGGEESVAISSQILQSADVLVLGSPVFGKNFTPGNLPQTEFLVKQFEGGARVPGFAAALLTAAPTLEAREEAVRRSPAAKVVSTLLRRLEKGVQNLPNLPATLSSFKLPNPSSWRVSLSSWFKKRVSHGQELAKERQKEAENTKPIAVSPKGQIKLNPRTISRVIILLILVFIASVAFTTYRQAQAARQEEFNRIMAESSHSLAEAEGLVGLSNERASEILVAVLASLDRAQEVWPKGEGVGTLRDRAEATYKAIEKITDVAEGDAVYDLSLQEAGAVGSALAGTGNTLYAAIQEGGIYAVNLAGDLPQVSRVGGTGFSGVRELVWEQNQLYALTAKTLYRYNLSTKKLDEPVFFEGYNKVSELGTYLSNIYFLVPQDNQIYRFFYGSGGYSRARNRIEDGTSVESASGMGIDEDIWLTQDATEITRISAGKKVGFSVSNLSTPFKQLSKIFTLPNYKNLYILDVGNSRIVILDKSGSFLGQLKGEMLGAARDLWVPSGEKFLYFLSGSKIYRVPLKL
ncbi:MAG: hypothetical protein WEC39_02075 [Patescibacteria group bacterium]